MYDPATPDDIRRTAKLWNARIAQPRSTQHGAPGPRRTRDVWRQRRRRGHNLLAEHAFNTENYDGCETMLFGLIENFYQQETWRNKGFLLLVSTYIGLNDLFQARATAESILANVQAPDVQEAVSDLLFEIDALEAAQNAPDANTNGDETPNQEPESNDE